MLRKAEALNDQEVDGRIWRTDFVDRLGREGLPQVVADVVVCAAQLSRERGDLFDDRGNPPGRSELTAETRRTVTD